MIVLKHCWLLSFRSNKQYRRDLLFFKVNIKYIWFKQYLFIIRYIHAYIQTIQLTIGSDSKHSAYMKVIS